ncbi:hypothetical protein BASA81_006844 [Batrachochytrium salamandrivorans]|nr:hypothetical protein BASA81_006844 [Batrachochytrium salamandrivorans]
MAAEAVEEEVESGKWLALLAAFPVKTLPASTQPLDTFELLGHLAERLTTSSPSELLLHKSQVEQLLKEFCLSRGGGEVAQPVLDRVEQCFALVYSHSDSRDMLQIAGELQDACKQQQQRGVNVQACCLHALSGIAQSRGKALSGHLVDTLTIADSLSVSGVATGSKYSMFSTAPGPSSTKEHQQQLPADKQTWMVGAIRASQHGLIGAGESTASKANWPIALRFFAKVLGCKKFPQVRIAAAAALESIALTCVGLAEKITQLLFRQLAGEITLPARLALARAIAGTLTVGGGKIWVPPTTASTTTGLPPKAKLEALDLKVPLVDICDSLLQTFHSESGGWVHKQTWVAMFVSLVAHLPAVTLQEEIAIQAQWALQFASTDVSCAAQALREGIGARHGERLQLALARTLLDITMNSASSTSVKQACSIELCYLIATLGEAAGSLQVGKLNDPSVMRALCVSVPQLIPQCGEQWGDSLVNGLGNAEQTKLACQMLSSIVLAAASVNRQGAIQTTQLFGLCKALASRTLEEDMDPFAVPGWHLLTALLHLGPASFAPHLVQFLMLWSESFDSLISDAALTACLVALVALLRNCEAKHYVVLQRAVSALLLPHKDKFSPSVRSLPCQTAFFQLFAELGKTRWMDSTVLVHMPLAMFHLMTPKEPTSLLQVGGLLDSADDILSAEEKEEEGEEQGGGATGGEYEYMTSAGLHALVGRRARMRKPLAQRVKHAMQGGAYAEVLLATADPRSVASTSRSALVDSAICVVASSFAFGSSKLRLQILSSLQAKYLATPHSVNKDLNLASLLLALVRLTLDGAKQQSGEDASSWQQALYSLAWPFLKHGEVRIRRAVAQTLALFATKLATTDFYQQLKHNVEQVLGNASEPDSNFVGSALLLAVKLGKDDLGQAISLCCLNGGNATRTWALHCWVVFVNHVAMDPTRHLASTVKLLLLDLFSPSNPHCQHLGRVLVCLANALNAEMMEPSRQPLVSTLVSVWMWLKNQPKAKDSCVLFLDRLYYFHAPHTKRRTMFTTFLFDALHVDSELVFATALPCFLRLCEDEIVATGGGAEFSIGHVPLIFDALERFGRSLVRPGAAAVVVNQFSGPLPLRKTWQDLEMSGACTSPLPQQVSNNSLRYFYPPEMEEDACKTLSEIIRISSEQTLVEFAAYLTSVVGNRDIRWQTKLVALEALNQVVLRSSTTGGNLLLSQLDGLVTCVCQISTLTVGDFDVCTIQTRGLACLYSLSHKFAANLDPQDSSLPLLRQYEAQLNATLRPGLRNHIQADLSEEAGLLVCLLLVSSISTSAKRLVAQLDEEEDGEGSERQVFVDDTSRASFRLGRCTAFARLCVASFSGREDGTKLRSDALERVRAALSPTLLTQLCAYWLRIVRDYFVLANNAKGAAKRHPDATYLGGRSAEEVEQLLPLYAQAWPLCAMAAAYCLDGPFWPTQFDVSLLVLACTRAIAMEEEPIKAIGTLEICRQKRAWRLDTDLSGIYSALLQRGKRAFSHRKLATRDACLKCLESLLLLQPANSMGEKEWSSLFIQLSQCLPPTEPKMKLLARFHLGKHLPSTLTEVFLTSAAYQAATGGEGGDVADCVKVFTSLQCNSATTIAVAMEFVLHGGEGNAQHLFAFWVGIDTPALTEQRHQELMKRMLSEPLGKPLLQAVVSLLKQQGEKKRIGQYYATKVANVLLWQAQPEPWLGSDELFALVCVLQLLLHQPSQQLVSRMLDLFFRDLERHARRKVWSQFLNQLVQVHKPAFQTYLATTPNDQKQVLRDFMT